MLLDNFFTGTKKNIQNLYKYPNFELIRHDVTEPIKIEVDKIWHLACPASPIHYQHNPIKTTKSIFMGTYNMLGLDKRVGAKFLLASTSEIYGDPEVHPQTEDYRGSVNTTGIRSCYDEGKRIAETLCSDYLRMHGVDIIIMRSLKRGEENKYIYIYTYTYILYIYIYTHIYIYIYMYINVYIYI